MLKLIEIDLTLKLKENIGYKQLPEKIAKGINYYFLINKKLKELHERNEFKFYSVGTLLPIEKDKLYRKDKCYNLTLRFMNPSVLNDFYKGLSTIENPIFSILSRSFTVINEPKEEKIEYIETLTPAVISYNNKNLDVYNMDLDLVKKRATSNINRKYATLKHLDNIHYDFIEDVELLNRKSIVFDYKNGCIIANKYRFKIKEDELSQKLAFIALSIGILEKNSLSFGFCKAIMEEIQE